MIILLPYTIISIILASTLHEHFGEGTFRRQRFAAISEIPGNRASSHPTPAYCLQTPTLRTSVVWTKNSGKKKRWRGFFCQNEKKRSHYHYKPTTERRDECMFFGDDSATIFAFSYNFFKDFGGHDEVLCAFFNRCFTCVGIFGMRIS